ncbi:MAG TPA: PHP domain-containing protein, partial [Dehalococcoidia bacterium]
MPYCELHLHSCFSFREGASTPIELALQASKLGYRALALTDHDNLAGAMEFARAAKAWGVRPITGAEVTLAGGHHLTLLAESPKGYANLSRLLTRANLGNPRGEPR